MRVAVRPTGDLGRRAVHVLLADRAVEAVGVLGTQPSDTAGGRLQAAVSEEGWDVLVLDTDAGSASARVPVVASANPELWLLAALAAAVAGRHESATLSAAWTEPGPPLTAGTRVRFPDPVGPLLASAAAQPPLAPAGDYMLAPGAPEPWIGLSVSANGRGQADRVAVAEHADFLRGVTLAAAAMAVVQTGGWEATGFWRALIENARRRGIVVASPKGR